ncbi:acyl-CoA synthetase (AMP-forming)/AMP-acid ligase II [Galbibacter orientalis DSM 19592]|uniref:Acyl-CoA synthetase (AMP-forming)/AMP-acid ligase II n=1 Tax=Galbibacter orientalis DSM 19592 TaxID=926559 RepID=I3C9Q7_9FLAO|nr:AMP-binding protein [Galbibacter orientalis]EIJ40350.1 acyl-CoA synthetase (AMP-forming)/AMP-acid ligase II [Galbibacter orientalis DSM 19592]
MENTPSFDKVHLRFKLNGTYFDREDLKEVAYSFVKEGEPYEQSIGDFLMDWLNNKDHLYVRTSGSTGTPKHIRIQKQFMVNSAIASGDFFNISVGDSALHCLPAEYIAGKMMLVRAMILGLEIDLVAPTLHPLIEKEYDFSAMIPLQVYNSLDKLNNIKQLIVGGAAVKKELIESVQNKDTLVYETYGMTETVTHIAAKQINNFRSAEAMENAHFKVLPNVKVTLDKRNCLVIDAPYIAEETIVTNDIVALISADEFDWKGRYDNIINSGGVKLIPEQIEKKLAPIVQQRFFVYGIEDAELGEKLIMVVEGKEDSKLETEIKKVGDLEKFEHPKSIYFLDKFLETKNGKVIREPSVHKALGA